MSEQIRRIAMRQEGASWNCYFANGENMRGAILLGSIRMNLVVANKERKSEFVKLMTECASDLIEDITGVRPNYDTPTPAPEHERSGNG